MTPEGNAVYWQLILATSSVQMALTYHCGGARTWGLPKAKCASLCRCVHLSLSMYAAHEIADHLVGQQGSASTHRLHGAGQAVVQQSSPWGWRCIQHSLQPDAVWPCAAQRCNRHRLACGRLKLGG